LWIRSRHTRVLIDWQRHPTAKVAHSSRSADRSVRRAGSRRTSASCLAF
jgi:hypothetical protein